jgi:hypothetical protein
MSSIFAPFDPENFELASCLYYWHDGEIADHDE